MKLLQIYFTNRENALKLTISIHNIIRSHVMNKYVYIMNTEQTSESDSSVGYSSQECRNQLSIFDIFFASYLALTTFSSPVIPEMFVHSFCCQNI